MNPDPLTIIFTAKAESVSATVVSVDSLDEAFDYAVDLCDQKDACQLLISGCDLPLSTEADNLSELKQEKVMAAPGLKAPQQKQLATMCQDRGISFANGGLRRYLAGIDIGFTIADYGIAETGTLVLKSTDEDLRLATMISEVHVAVLPLSRLRNTALEMEKELQTLMVDTPSYLSFITGPSRTADIERVLALGVHGPLEVHILLWEDR